VDAVNPAADCARCGDGGRGCRDRAGCWGCSDYCPGSGYVPNSGLRSSPYSGFAPDRHSAGLGSMVAGSTKAGWTTADSKRAAVANPDSTNPGWRCTAAPDCRPEEWRSGLEPALYSPAGRNRGRCRFGRSKARVVHAIREAVEPGCKTLSQAPCLPERRLPQVARNVLPPVVGLVQRAVQLIFQRRRRLSWRWPRPFRPPCGAVRAAVARACLRLQAWYRRFWRRWSFYFRYQTRAILAGRR